MSTVETGISWTDRTWNPLRGCTLVSSGCTHCYAMTLAWRFHGPGQPYEGLTRMTSKGPVWTGEVRLIEQDIEQPLRWKRPARIFVNSMSDLFHESVEDAWLDRIFAVMNQAKWHTFQILTKRPGRASRWRGPWTENIWMGTSVEDTATLYRLNTLWECAAQVKFVSVEPLLTSIIRKNQPPLFTGYDWVIVGGESGPKARQCKIAWIREVVQHCQEAGVACFVKQLGKSNRCPHDAKGGHLACFPPDLRIQAFPSQEAA